jgi:hypothetical protein
MNTICQNVVVSKLEAFAERLRCLSASVYNNFGTYLSDAAGQKKTPSNIDSAVW